MRELTEIERKKYDLIKEVGEIQTTNLPDKRMGGTIPNLKNMGLVEVYKKYTSFFRSKKRSSLGSATCGKVNISIFYSCIILNLQGKSFYSVFK